MKKAIQKKKVPKRRKKNIFTDGIQAFFLVGLIVVFAIAISMAIISIHITMNRTPNKAASGSTSEGQGSLPLTVPDTKVTLSVKPVDPQITENSRTLPVPVPDGNRTTNDRLPVQPKPPVRDNTRVPDTSSNVIVVPPKNVENIGTIVFVIDDAGNNLRELEPFLRIPAPLTIAVLPGLPFSSEAAKRIRAAGKEVILHQPMEAQGGQNPGPGAIYSNMSPEEIRNVLSRNIAEVGPVTGINNHQGSKITMDAEIMKTILAFCVENKIYFLDSRTTADSVVPAVARQMGIKIAERNVFIDNEQNKDAMLRYISTGLLRAQRNGSAIMIGHAWSPDLAPLLTEQIPLLSSQGYKIMSVSDIIR